MTLIPPSLQIGDTMGVVTPSGPISSSPSPDPHRELEKGIAYLTDLGFEVQLGEHALLESGLAAGTPEERAGDINAMFADPGIQAIISTHGGVSAVRVCRCWIMISFKPTPKTCWVSAISARCI